MGEGMNHRADAAINDWQVGHLNDDNANLPQEPTIEVSEEQVCGQQQAIIIIIIIIVIQKIVKCISWYLLSIEGKGQQKVFQSFSLNWTYDLGNAGVIIEQQELLMSYVSLPGSSYTMCPAGSADSTMWFFIQDEIWKDMNDAACSWVWNVMQVKCCNDM